MNDIPNGLPIASETSASIIGVDVSVDNQVENNTKFTQNNHRFDFSRIRLFHRWRWAILPVILITVFQIDTHYFYNSIWLSYDQPDHFNNVVALINTGEMPPPIPKDQHCSSFATCEAQQPPLFYEIMAIPTRAIMTITAANLNDAGLVASKIVLFIMSMIWFWLILCAVQMIMARQGWLAKALVACAAMLIAQVVVIDSSLTNDFAESVASLAAILVLYLIARTDRKLKPQWWILAAALVGLCIAFKYSGVQVLGVYMAIVGCIAFGYLIKRRGRKLIRVVSCAAIGMPLVIIPYITTVQHAVYEVGGVVNTRDVSFDPSWDGRLIPFFATFATDVLRQPMWNLEPGVQPGDQSFWSIQYDTLFADFINRWVPPAEFSLPSDKLKIDRLWSHPLSLVRYNNIILVTNLAIPLAVLMGIALLALSFRSVFHPRRALRDGSLVIWFTGGATLGTFVIAMFQNGNSWWFTQPRYALFTYVLLLIAGAAWIQKLWPQHRGLVLPAMRTVLWASIVVFCAASYALFWLTA